MMPVFPEKSLLWDTEATALAQMPRPDPFSPQAVRNHPPETIYNVPEKTIKTLKDKLLQSYIGT